LLSGPLAVAPLTGFLDQLETVLTPSLLADPYSDLGSTPEEIAGYFEEMRQWVTNRHANVLQQVQAEMLAGSPASTPEPTTLAMVGIALIGVLRRRIRAAARGQEAAPR